MWASEARIIEEVAVVVKFTNQIPNMCHKKKFELMLYFALVWIATYVPTTANAGVRRDDTSSPTPRIFPPSKESESHSPKHHLNIDFPIFITQKKNKEKSRNAQFIPLN